VAKRIEEIIPQVYRDEKSEKDGYLHKLLASFQQELLPFLKLEAKTDKEYGFADIYAQTVAYALFTARVFSHISWQKELQLDPAVKQPLFDRESAWQQLPETNPFLRKLFKDISEQKAEDLGDELITEIANIFGILRAAKMEAILSDFSQTGNRDDIIIHFYEPFLAAYNPNLKQKRGVYYTPESVVSYMVRSVDILLKEKLHKPLGLADPDAMILDPATGTGTFLLWIFQLVEQRFKGTDGDVKSHRLIKERFGDMSWSQYVRDHLLPRIFGFELLMAPYAIAHLKLGLFLQETGYQFNEGKRLSVYLTNTLDDSNKKIDVLFEQYISEESDQATAIKTDEKVMVVIGNPPYSAKSQNLSDDARKWIENYRFIDGKRIKEKCALQFEKNLQEDYIKFIRFAEWKINKTGYGILAFVSNHSYLDSPTLRGMRSSLSNTFDTMFLLDLHGNSNVKEKCPDGSNDKNIFKIQQGVSVGFFVRQPEGNSFLSTVYHDDLYGDEKFKNRWLSESSITTTEWEKINPKFPNYLFVPQNTDLLDEYEKGYKITDIFPVNSVGIGSARDNMVVDFQKEPIMERVQVFRDLLGSDEFICQELNISQKQGWNIKKARASIQQESNLKRFIESICYRPFDNRFIFYHDSLVWTTARKVMRHVISDDNLALCFIRRSREDNTSNFFVVDGIVDKTIISSSDNASVAPLYICFTTPAEIKMGITRKPNISNEFITAIATSLGYTPTPEDILHYIYAIFYSPTYRSRYAEFLKIDFPRVPLTSNDQLFRQLADYGEQLVQLHLMTSPKLDNLITEFVEGEGERTVAKGHPKYQDGAVQINKNGDKFTGVPEEVWNFYVGGYQPCQKWLKDRKERTLSDEDILHYQKVVVSLKETIELMTKIDQAIPSFPIQ
jgi:predicted helicase